MSDLGKEYPRPIFRKFILVKGVMNWKALEPVDSPVVWGLIDHILLSAAAAAVTLSAGYVVLDVCCSHENRVQMTALALFIAF